MNTPKYIIIHCSATKVTSNFTVEQIIDMHKQRGFNTIGYHYYITKDGDTLALVANTFETTENELLKNNSTIYLREGQLIVNKNS